VDRAEGLSVRAFYEARRVSGASHFVREGVASVWWRARERRTALNSRHGVFPTWCSLASSRFPSQVVVEKFATRVAGVDCGWGDTRYETTRPRRGLPLRSTSLSGIGRQQGLPGDGWVFLGASWTTARLRTPHSPQRAPEFGSDWNQRL